MYRIKMQRAKLTKRKWVLGFLIATSIFTLTACSDSDNPTTTVDDNLNTGAGNNVPAVDPDNDVLEPGETFVPVVDPNDVVPEPSENSISVALRENMDFSTMLLLIERADLAGALDENNGGNGWTLFAFSNNASGAEDVAGLTGDEAAVLVGGHLFSGRLLLADIQPGGLTMTRGSINVTVNENGTIDVGGASIIARDRQFSNGVIHFIDSVLETF